MLFFKVVKKSAVIFYLTLAIVVLAGIIIITHSQDAISAINQDVKWDDVINELFSTRNECVLNNDSDTLKTLFYTEERNGRWAYENEAKRAKYIDDWSQKQGVIFLSINSTINIKRAKPVGRGYAFYIVASNEYRYVYENDRETENTFRLGTYHSVDLIPGNDSESWVISREWYDDPLSDTFKADEKTADITAYITAQPPLNMPELNERRIAAVEYADLYCGAASDGKNDYQYNKNYSNYNSLGGDCANFASQILHEGGGFKKNGTWNYKNGKGSRSWINAQGFKDYWLYSGNASMLVHGKYEDVYKQAYKLLPGDIVAYAKKGKVTHIAIVTGLDSKGYPLVSCHNADRSHVPWDIGWSNSKITFYFLSVHY